MYFFPLTPSTKHALEAAFARYAPASVSMPNHNTWMSKVVEGGQLAVYGHVLTIPKVHSGRPHAYFHFNDLCNNNFGAVDFIEVGKLFRVVAIEGIPRLSIERRNELRRFITLVDALYERKVLVLWQADCDVKDLLAAEDINGSISSYDEVFAFDRTVSRLLEMQSHEYLLQSCKLSDTAIFHNNHGSGGSNGSTQNESLAAILRLSDCLNIGSCSAAHPDIVRMMERLWRKYRIGFTDEIHDSNNDDSSSGGRFRRQSIRRDALNVVLVDIVDHYFRNARSNDPVVNKVARLIEEKLSITNSHASFDEFSKVVSQVIDASKSSTTT